MKLDQIAADYAENEVVSENEFPINYYNTVRDDVVQATARAFIAGYNSCLVRIEKSAKEKYPEMFSTPNKQTTIFNAHQRELQRAFIAGAQSAWIPVTERLPEESGSYMVYGRLFGDCPMSVLQAEYNKKARKFTINWVKTKGITHWMPLPPKP